MLKRILNFKNKNIDKDACSFYTIKKSLIFPEGDILETPEQDNFEDYNELFSYDDKLIQEYNLMYGTNTLFCDLGNDTIAYLYEHEIYEDGDHLYSIYEKDDAFVMVESKGQIQRLLHTTAKDFNTLDRKFNNTTRLPLINKINSYRFDSFINSHADIIVDNYRYYNTKRNKALSDRFRKAFMKYKMSECIIPCSVILNDIQALVNQYIATRELDEEELLGNYMMLANFGEFCYSSLELISPFVHNPKNTDLQKLSEGLDKKIDDIDYLIHLYLEEELKCASRNQNQEKGEH